MIRTLVVLSVFTGTLFAQQSVPPQSQNSYSVPQSALTVLAAEQKTIPAQSKTLAQLQAEQAKLAPALGQITSAEISKIPSQSQRFLELAVEKQRIPSLEQTLKALAEEAAKLPPVAKLVPSTK